jgi:glycosyltransferase involved in cell wall biosynthesis
MKKIKKPTKQLRILINSNDHRTFSGYAQTLNEILPYIVNEGYALGVISFFGQDGFVSEADGAIIYPKVNNPYGDDAMVVHGKDFKADIVISNQDTWTLDPALLRQIPRWIPWVPIDHDPVPPPVVERMNLAYRIVACSQFGKKQLRDFGLASTYIPYSVNTEIFKPMDKKEMRKKFGIPEDGFVFGMVAANKDMPPRKSFQEVMDAFKLFLANHPDAYLYLNVPMHNPQGFPILEYAKFIGISERVFHNDNYNIFFKFGKDAVAQIINCFDVSLNPSMSEGFGLNVIEAQSCGVPIITNDFASMPELIIDGVTGWKTKVAHKRFTHMLSYVGDPDTQDLARLMEESYVADRAKMGEEGRKYVQENYDTKLVWEKNWKPYLEKIEAEIYSEKK